MEIHEQKSTEHLIYYIQENGERLAEIVSSFRGEDRIIIEHTEVSEALGGKGIGKKLVDKVVEYAREHKLKIVPMCSFARSVFERFREKYEDVL